jgi:hypothetical protein
MIDPLTLEKQQQPSEVRPEAVCRRCGGRTRNKIGLCRRCVCAEVPDMSTWQTDRVIAVMQAAGRELKRRRDILNGALKAEVAP